MPFDMNNDYTHAGPGAKRRRERLTLETIPKKIAKHRPKPYQHRKPENAKEETIGMTARGMKAKIALLTLQHASFGDIYERLDREGYGVASKILVSHVRDQTMQVLRVIMDEGLITQKSLDAYREQSQANYRSRFKRKREAD
jgi:hypothetical protein